MNISTLEWFCIKCRSGAIISRDTEVIQKYLQWKLEIELTFFFKKTKHHLSCCCSLGLTLPITYYKASCKYLCFAHMDSKYTIPNKPNLGYILCLQGGTFLGNS